jgi:AmmeMemoRadiSam system protein B
MKRRRFIASAAAFLSVPAVARKVKMQGRGAMNEKTFPCSGAGRWFPDSKKKLAGMIDAFLAQAEVSSKAPVAVVAPHAGYVYSGLGQACSYKVFAGKKIDRVVILGPSHSAYFRGISVLTGYGAYETPLGSVRINGAGVDALRKEKLFVFQHDAHRPEHSVENQIPFIQHVLPGAEIVPCVTGRLSGADFQAAGEGIKKLLDGKTVIAVSSDFTHYGGAFGYVPFKDNFRKNLEKLDGGAIREIEKADSKAFRAYVEKTGATICGRDPIAVMLCAVSGSARGRLLKYYTSSDETGDFSHTVCYASIVMEKV